MAKEIERKFLVDSREFEGMASRVIHIEQGYLSTEPTATVRVRIADDDAYLTIKGRNRGIVRDEWEYPIPATDASEMLARCATGTVVIKDRYIVPWMGHTWEVDVFGGHLAPLVIAEVELESVDDNVAPPSFVGREVTGDPRYYNSSLASASAAPTPEG